MQQRSLEFAQTQKTDAVDREIAKEKASALGITGQRLQARVAEYQRRCEGGLNSLHPEVLISRIAETLQELLIQRESMGLPYQNLEWVLRTYQVPDTVLAKLGLRDDPRHLFQP